MENGNLHQVITDYMTYIKKKKKVSASTASAYQTDLLKFNEYLSEGHNIQNISDLNPSIIMSYLLKLKQEKKASSSISRRMSVIKNFLLYGYHQNLIDEDLYEHKYEIPKDEKKLPEILTIEEINIILSQPEETPLGIRDRAMLEILYSSGLKVNELIQLSMCDLDMKLKIIQCGKGKVKRILPLGAMAYDALSIYLKDSRQQLIKDETPYVFLSYNGDKISRQGFWKLVKKYADQAGIEKNISISTFRHSFASHMIENGIHKDVLKDALGNTSVASIQKYLDLNRKRQQGL
ncbi:MAG: tyrosine-type recombinase/integrase [Clostridia bacterium]|nr:tyrosine-type recombinase/integrase [Clostridia bacterium]